MLDAIYKAHTFRSIPTKITALVLEQLQFKDVDELLRADVEKKLPVDKRLSIVPLLFDAAFENDTISVNLVKEISKAFAGLIFGGVNRFSLNNTEFEVVISGSIFKAKGNLLIDTFTNEINRFAPRAKVVNAFYEPVVGAVILGIEHFTKTIDNKVMENIEKSSEKFSLRRNSSNQ
jgi:N-acetylglucosamine kinase-like BadF-type ATPase